MVKRFVALACMTLGLAAPASSEQQDVSLVEFPTENQALIDATIAFFDKVEGHRVSRKRAPVIGIPLSATKSSARTQSDEDTSLLTRMGPVDHLTGYRITWYPVDHLLGTVDFMGTWDNSRNLVCGYLTWDLSDPESPQLAELSASFIDIDELARANGVQIEQSLMDANCAFGEIDDNYRIFDVTG